MALVHASTPFQNRPVDFNSFDLSFVVPVRSTAMSALLLTPNKNQNKRSKGKFARRAKNMPLYIRIEYKKL